MNSVDTGVGTSLSDSFRDHFRVHSSLAKIDERVEHPEGVVVLAEVETSLVEHVHSSVVTVKAIRRHYEEIRREC